MSNVFPFDHKTFKSLILDLIRDLQIKKQGTENCAFHWLSAVPASKCTWDIMSLCITLSHPQLPGAVGYGTPTPFPSRQMMAIYE